MVADVAKEACHRLVGLSTIVNVAHDAIVEEEAVVVLCGHRLKGYTTLNAEIARDGERAVADVVLLVQPCEDGVELLRDVLRICTDTEVATQIDRVFAVGEADLLLVAIEDEHDEALGQEVLGNVLVTDLGVVARDEGTDTRSNEALRQLWLL